MRKGDQHQAHIFYAIVVQYQTTISAPSWSVVLNWQGGILPNLKPTVFELEQLHHPYSEGRHTNKGAKWENGIWMPSNPTLGYNPVIIYKHVSLSDMYRFTCDLILNLFLSIDVLFLGNVQVVELGVKLGFKFNSWITLLNFLWHSIP